MSLVALSLKATCACAKRKPPNPGRRTPFSVTLAWSDAPAYSNLARFLRFRTPSNPTDGRFHEVE
jgi:hypothetical protein